MTVFLYGCKWAILSALIGVVGWLHRREQKQLSQNTTSPHLILSALTRCSTQLLILLTLIFVVIITHDIRSLQKPAPVPAPFPAAAIHAPEAKIPLPHASASGLPFEGVSVFAEKDGTTQAWLDLIKQRYEKLFVTYYYLLHCRAAGREDFAALQSALQADLASVKAPPGTGDNILQAAVGTYSEIYARSPCRNEDILPIKQSLDSSLSQLSARRAKSAD